MICENCEGTGGNTYRYDPSPAGVGLPAGTMEDWAECTTCGGLGMVDPEPCPFCGGEDLQIDGGPMKGDHVFVRCNTCGAQGPGSEEQDDAVRAWIDR